jgi:hypothetical protein
VSSNAPTTPLERIILVNALKTVAIGGPSLKIQPLSVWRPALKIPLLKTTQKDVLPNVLLDLMLIILLGDVLLVALKTQLFTVMLQVQFV